MIVQICKQFNIKQKEKNVDYLIVTMNFNFKKHFAQILKCSVQ